MGEWKACEGCGLRGQCRLYPTGRCGALRAEAEARLAAMRTENLQLHQLLHNADVVSENQEKALAAAEAVRCKNCNVREELEAALAEAQTREKRYIKAIDESNEIIADLQAKLAAAEKRLQGRPCPCPDECHFECPFPARIAALEASLKSSEAATKAYREDRDRLEAENARLKVPARPEPKRKPDPWQNHDARKRGRRSK